MRHERAAAAAHRTHLASGYRGTRYVPAIRSGMPRDGLASATTIPARPSSQGNARIQGQVTSGSHHESEIDQRAGETDVGRNIRNGAHTITARTRCLARPARLPSLVWSEMPPIRNSGPLNAHVRSTVSTDAIAINLRVSVIWSSAKARESVDRDDGAVRTRCCAVSSS